MLDLKNTYILLEDSRNNKLYKAPLEALGGMFLLNNGDNETVVDILLEIDALSSLILNLSAYISASCFCREEVENRFEMISAVSKISADTNILTSDQLTKYPPAFDMIRYEDAESEFMKVEGEIDSAFSKIDTESNRYF